MVPRLSSAGVSNNPRQGTASIGHGSLRRQFAGFDSWDSVLGGIGDLANTVGGVVNSVNGQPKPANAPAPAKPPGWKNPLILGGAALAVVAVLFFALRRR